MRHELKVWLICDEHDAFTCQSRWSRKVCDCENIRLCESWVTYENFNMCHRWFQIWTSRYDVKLSRSYRMKPAVAHIQILTYYSTFVQTNASQLQSFWDQRASHISVTSLTHVSCVMTHSCVGHDSIICGMTHSHVYHVSVPLYTTTSILHISHDSFLRETWLNHMWLTGDSHVNAGHMQYHIGHMNESRVPFAKYK